MPVSANSTLTAALIEAARGNHGIVHVQTGRDDERIVYATLLERAARVLSRLREAGSREGDEILIATDDHQLFVSAFWGCLLGRMIAVPVAVPTNDETALKIVRIAARLRRPTLLSDHDLSPRLAAVGGEDPIPGGRKLILDGPDDDSPPAEAETASPDDVAFIQFSSGSTGSPKGVTLTHANLIANVSAIMDHLGEAGRDARLLSWMPLTHDFGIIWFHLMAVVFDLEHCLIPTKQFIRNPLIWFQKTSEFRATVLGGPNYSYRHFLKHHDPAVARDWDLSSVRVIVNGAEPISCELTREFLAAGAPYGLSPDAMMPAYGLAEGTLCVTLTPVGVGMRALRVDRRSVAPGTRVVIDDKSDDGGDRVWLADVGHAVDTVGLTIVDDEGRDLPEGVVGRILISGPSVTRGYRDDPEATAAAIRPDGRLDTGDLGFLLNGRLVVTGRRKDVIIVNGVNHYPQDIERVASEVPGLDLNMVMACSVPTPDGEREGLVVFVVFRKSAREFAPIAALTRDAVLRRVGLPVEHCLPVQRLPKTTSGKLQRFLMVERFKAGAFDAAVEEERRLRETEGEALREAWRSRDRDATREALMREAARITPVETIDAEAPLMDLGFTSVRLTALAARLGQALDVELPVSLLFERPTLNALADALLDLRPRTEATRAVEEDTPANGTERRVAVLGLACRLPGGVEGPDGLADLLERGIDATGPAPEGRWSTGERRLMTTDRGGYLDDLVTFDARFFNLTPVEAEAMDPRQRLALTVVWEALENAGIDPTELRGGRTGVYVGISGSDARPTAGADPETIGAHSVTGAAASVAAGRLSFFLGLRGPCLSIDTACSSSLVAAHLATRDLRAGDCDTALVVGVNLLLDPELQIGLSRMTALSPDGRCKTFDATADGYGRGEGCVAVVLRRLDDATGAGSRIRAVIAGSAVNHDGAAGGLTAPNGEAQREVLRAALADARLRPLDVDHVEAHGTGTALGDPIEITALAAVYGEDRERPLTVGSVKTNIGHLEAAAGLAGLATAVLAIERGRTFAPPRFGVPNPRIPWREIPVAVATGGGPAPRRIGVSAFGMSGTNAHLVVEAPPEPVSIGLDPRPNEPALLALSARTPEDLVALAGRYAAVLNGAPRLHDVALEAALGRTAFRHRLAVVARDGSAAAGALSATSAATVGEIASQPRVLFAFAGQGSQSAGVGRNLFEREPAFRDSLLAAERILRDDLARPLTELLFDPAREEELARTENTQPAVVALGLALAELFRSWNIVPAATLGHSVGEITAAAVAGVFDAETALRFAARRGALIGTLPPGAMIAAAVSPARATALIERLGLGVEIAAYNGAESVTLAGGLEETARLAETLREEGARVVRLNVSHAFHSRAMDPILGDLRNFLASRRLAEPRIPVHSTLIGRVAPVGRLSDPGHWVRHAREPVRFADALTSIPVEPGVVVVELGARAVLAAPAATAASETTWLPLLGGSDSEARFLGVLGRLFEIGVPLDRRAVFARRPGRRIPVPNYPFQGHVKVPNTHRVPVASPIPVTSIVASPPPVDRRSEVVRTVLAALRGLAGIDPAVVDRSANWFALGLDSLLIVQLQQALVKGTGVELTLAEVMERGRTVDELAALVAERLPPLPVVAPVASPIPTGSAPAPAVGLEAVFAKQMEAMNELFRAQLAVIGGGAAALAAPAPVSTPTPAPVVAVEEPSREVKGLFKKAPARRGDWSPAQTAHVRRLTAERDTRTAGSKALTDEFRSVFANPRATIGFRPEWKELTYPLHVVRAEGAHVWDVDGNRYVDITMGFGVTLMGHNPPFVRDAIAEELAGGLPIGPQSPRSGRVARLISELTGVERVAFFTTGSEAVMVATRLARAVTGRNKVVMFVNSYHGTFDGLLAVGWANLEGSTTMPLTDGTPPAMVDDVIVCRYGDPDALEVIRRRAGEIAAVLVEPVQSRDPAVQPADFLRELRTLTTERDIALIFDEMIMGFRAHLGGAQAHFGIRADIVTYGKIVGAGMPIGVVAGSRRFLDMVDGGVWRYGDDSVPSARTAFVAGTFNNHPLTMAAAEAMLTRLKAEGPGLQERLNARTAAMCADLDALFEAEEVPVRTAHFSSLFRFDFAGDTEILNHHLLRNGIFVWEGRNCFLSTAHSDDDIQAILDATRDGIAAMRTDGWLPPKPGGGLPKPTAEALPTSRGQREMWAAIQARPEASLAYNEMIALDLTGPFDPIAFGRALDRVVERRDSLRTLAIEGETRRIGAATIVVPEPETVADDDAAVDERLAAELDVPFDLSNGPFIRVRSWSRGPDRTVLALIVHHIVTDGWSLGVLADETARLYAAERAGRPLDLPPPRPFADYVAWSASLPVLPAPEWGEAPRTTLPVDEERNGKTPSFAGGRTRRREPVEAGALARVKGFARERGLSPVAVALAGFALLVARLADRTRIRIGLPVAGHVEAGMPDMVGHASTVVPLTLDVDPAAGFATLVGHVGKRIADAGPAARYLSRLVPDAAPPAVDILFNMDRGVTFALDGARTRWLSPPIRHPKLSLFLNIIEVNGEALFDLDWDGALIGPETAARWFDSLLSLWSAGIAAPERAVRELPLSPADRAAIETAGELRVVDGFGVPAAIGVTARVERGGVDTGDLGRTRADGSVQRLGRADRLPLTTAGRIDLDAIEAEMRGFPPAREAVVILEDDRPTAFVVPGARGLSIAAARGFVARIADPAKRPARLAVIAAVPRRADGTVDADVLCALPVERVPARVTTPPRTAEEKAVATVWREVLRIDEVGIEDDFFALGGDSLRALTMLARIEAGLGRRIPPVTFFANPTIAGLLAAAPGPAPEIPRISEAPDYPASGNQARLWTLERLTPGLVAYNIGFALISTTPFDVEATRRALVRLTERHEVLRTAIVDADGEPRQVIHPAVEPDFRLVEVRDAETARSVGVAVAMEPFDTARAPLWRVRLISSGGGDRLVVVIHHMIGDVWSIAVMIRDLTILLGMENAPGGRPGTLPAQPIRFRDHAAWLATRETGSETEDWIRRLSEPPPPPLGLPTDRPRPTVAGGRGDNVRISVPANVADATRAIAASRGAGPFTAMTAAVLAWLNRLTGRTDILIGGVVAGRDHPATTDLMGFLVATAPLRATVDPSIGFADLIAAIRPRALEMIEHGTTPLEPIVRALGRRSPLFEVVLVMDDREEIRRALDGTGLTAEEIDTPTSQFDLTIYVSERPDGIDLKFTFDTDLFDRSRVAGWAGDLVASLTAVCAAPDVPLEEIAEIGTPPTFHQERLWFVDRFERGTLYPEGPTYYNMPVLIRPADPIDPERLRGVLDRLASRHELLRAALITDGERPALRVVPATVLPLDVIDAPTGRGEEIAIEHALRSFDLAAAPLFRAALVRERDGANLLALTGHHAVVDPRSLHRLATEIEALLTDPEATLPPAPGFLTAWATRERATADDHETDAAFWRTELTGAPVLVLPTDRPRPAVHTFTVGRIPLELDAAATTTVNEVAAALGLARRDVLRAAFLVVLARLSRQNDIVIGEPFEPEIPENLVGPATNLLVGRIDVSTAASFADLVRAAAATRARSEAHAGIPFDLTVLAIKPKNDMSRTALFDVLFRDESRDANLGPFGRIVESGLGWGKYDLVLTTRPNGETTSAVLAFNRDLFDETTARGIARRLVRAVEEGTVNPDTAPLELDLTTVEERRAIVDAALDLADYPRHLTVDAAFTVVAHGHPDRVALSDGKRSLTYRQLDAASNRVARALRNRGVAPDDRVAVLLDRSVAVPLAFLGVLKAGGAYLPIDPSLPAERIRFMIEDADARVIVTDTPHAEAAGAFGRTVLTIGATAETSGAELTPVARPENLAYVIYTSGSTGAPKGAMIEHRNVIQLLFHEGSPFTFGPDDVWSVFHSPSFDFSVWEMWGALLFGGRAVVVPREIARDPASFLDLASREGVTVLNQTPTAFNGLIEALIAAPDATFRPRLVVFGGEALAPARLAPWRSLRPDCRLVNMYGITETTVHVTFKEIGPAEIAAGRSVIGRPLPSYGVVLLGERLEILPPGLPGEICVSGHGVARGYLNRPELTAERFIEHPGLPGTRLYRSGDLGILSPDGELTYLGRIDHQVKIRGFRVELGEIERRLALHPKVREAAVLAEDESLVAFVVLSGEVSRRELRDHAAATLPDYMVPSRFVPVERIPLTANGKTDRAALSATRTAIEDGEDADEPTSLVQATAAAIWREVLGVERVGPSDNFFDLGGHSLMANQAVTRIKRRLGRPLDLRDFFSAPNLGALCALLESRAEERVGGIPRVPEAATHPLSDAQRRLWPAWSVEPDSVAYNMVGGFVLTGTIDVPALVHAFERLVDRHEILRTRFVDAAGEGRQIIDPPGTKPFMMLEDRTLDPDAVTRIVDEELRRGFDLTTGPLLRIRVADLAAEDDGRPRRALILNLHHIICDGWSVNVLLREVEALYRGTEPPLPTIQYKDYAAWRATTTDEDARRWWAARFEDAGELPPLPLDRPRPAKPSGRGGIVTAIVDEATSVRLRHLARERDAGLLTVLAALLHVQAHILTGAADVTIGTPVAGRDHVDLEGQIGFYLNLLALRATVVGDRSFNRLLDEERTVVLDAFAHQSHPFDRLVEDVDPPRGAGRHPLFDCLLILQNNDPLRLSLDGVEAEPIRDAGVSAKCDLNYMIEDRPALELNLEFAADLFDEATAARFAEQFVALARAVAEDPDRTPADLRSLLGLVERNAVRPAVPVGADDETADAW